MGRASRKGSGSSTVRSAVAALSHQSRFAGFGPDEELRDDPNGEEVQTTLVYFDPISGKLLETDVHLAFQYDGQGEEEGDRDERPWMREQLELKLIASLQESLGANKRPETIRLEHAFAFEYTGEEYINRDDDPRRTVTFRTEAIAAFSGEPREVEDPLRTLDQIDTVQSRDLFQKMILEQPPEEWMDRALLAHKTLAADRLYGASVDLGELGIDDPRIEGVLADIRDLRNDLASSPDDEDLAELRDRLEEAQRSIDWAGSVLRRTMAKIQVPPDDLQEILHGLQETAGDLRQICAAADRVL